MYKNWEEERFDCIVLKKRKREDQNSENNNVYFEMGSTLNNITPCAACKLLRRRCAEECPFSPYFSPHEPHKFAAVHKVFGASNVSKLLLEVGESQRADAANSLVYEANLRLRDPVYGCLGGISALEQQIQYLQSQLIAARAQIIKFKYRDQAAINDNKHVTSTSTTTCNASSLLVALPPESFSPRPSLPLITGPATPHPVLPCVVVSSSSNSSSVSSLYTPPTASSNGYNNNYF